MRSEKYFRLCFLVAALISLTGMTRMVEEQRIEIGTMKALGYGNFSIASKYLGYAFLATAGGSVLGVLVGEKILPYIIIYAYEIMYPHIPKIYVPIPHELCCDGIRCLDRMYYGSNAAPAIRNLASGTGSADDGRRHQKKGGRVFLGKNRIHLETYEFYMEIHDQESDAL